MWVLRCVLGIKERRSKLPTYDYYCTNCDHKLEIFHAMSKRPAKRCPECLKNTLKRKIGSGGGIIFRGEPFSSSTEYLKKNKKKKRGES